MKRVIVFTVFALLVLSSYAHALFNIMDPYAAEVLLNKQGIAYDLSAMRGAANVAVKDSIVLYCSHYDERVGVVLEDTSIRDSNGDEVLKGLSVRLQIPLTEKQVPVVRSYAEVKEVNIEEVDVDFLKSLGYGVEFYVRDTDAIDVDGDDRKPVEGETPRDPAPGDIPVDDVVVFADDFIDRDEVPKPVDEGKSEEGSGGGTGEDTAISPEGEIIDVPPPDDPYGKIMECKSIYLYKDDASISISSFTGDEMSWVYIVLKIGGSETMSREIREDINQIAKFYGLGESVLKQIDGNMLVDFYVNLVEPEDLFVGKFDFQSAMRTELEWLVKNGIVAGLTDQDIADISSVTKAGIAGWNSRLIYSKGRWMPYYETGDPWLIRTFEVEDADASAGGVEINMPKGEVNFAPASVRPNGKAIVTWGKLKSAF
jgi:hypothetical protein